MFLALARARANFGRYLAAPALAMPLTAIAGMGIAAATPLLHAAGHASGGMLSMGLAGASSAALGYMGGKVLARRTHRSSVYQRGTVIADASACSRLNSKAEVRAGSVSLAGVPVPLQAETQHFKCIGTTGTGKSTAIRGILAAALLRGDRAVIADPDGGYLRSFHDGARGDVILNPFDARSLKWDLFAELSSEFDVEQLAHSLIPDATAGDRSWTGYARTFFTAVTRQAHAAGVRDVAELYRLLVAADSSELRTLVRGTAAQPFLEEHNVRMFDSIRSVTSSAVGALDFVSRQNAMPFSVRRWVVHGSESRRGSVLFMPYQAGQIAALRSTISAWMRLAIFAAMDQPEGDQRLWFVIDELDALGPIDGLKDALARLRKFGGRCVLGFQSIGQVAQTYGGGEAQTIVENCSNTLILRCSASQGGGTAHFASRLIGQREVLRTTRSSSRRLTDWFASATRSEHIGIEPAVMDSEIEQLRDGQGFLKLSSDPRWLRVSLALPSADRLPAAPIATCPPAAPSPPPALLAPVQATPVQIAAAASEEWRRQKKADGLPPPRKANSRPKSSRLVQSQQTQEPLPASAQRRRQRQRQPADASVRNAGRVDRA
ncbi:MAG TPA: type IV secretion system DNA-binding domain-containing protein [Steroidobacteraceae bacterium]